MAKHNQDCGWSTDEHANRLIAIAKHNRTLWICAASTLVVVILGTSVAITPLLVIGLWLCINSASKSKIEGCPAYRYKSHRLAA